MMRFSRLIPLLFAAVLAAPGAFAQDGGAEPPGRLAIDTNLPDGLVFADGEFLGAASAQPFTLAPGTYDLVLVEPNREAWRPRRAEAAATVEAGATAAVRLFVPARYRIESVPFGATVTHEAPTGEETALGTTPLDLLVDEPLFGTFRLEKPGYMTVVEPAGEALENRINVVLAPLEYEADASVALPEERRPNYWIDVAAASVAVAAGAVAIYYKFEADNLYDEYLRTGDPELRPRFERYDDYSAAALGAMQVGVGVLAIRLVLR